MTLSENRVSSKYRNDGFISLYLALNYLIMNHVNEAEICENRIPFECCAENEKRLIKKCRELNAEIVSNAAKVQTALKLSEEDQNTIGSLKQEIEKAWKMVDASHEKVESSHY